MDVCAKCHGTFLDGIELKRVLGDDSLALALASATESAATKLACPACASPLYLDHVGDVELDHCKECLGVWLDAGEVERLAARAILLAARAAQMHLEEALTDVATGLRGGT